MRPCTTRPCHSTIESSGARPRHGESTHSLPLVRGTPSARTAASIASALQSDLGEPNHGAGCGIIITFCPTTPPTQYRPTVPPRTTPTRYSTTRTAKPAYQPTCRSNYPSRCAGLGLYDVEYRHSKPWRFGRIFFLRGVDKADTVTEHGRTGQRSTVSLGYCTYASQPFFPPPYHTFFFYFCARLKGGAELGCRYGSWFITQVL